MHPWWVEKGGSFGDLDPGAPWCHGDPRVGVDPRPEVQGSNSGQFGPISFEQICVALGVMSKMQLSLILHFAQENLVQRFGWKISEKASRAIRHLRKLASESSPPVGEGKIPKGKFLEPDSVPQAKRPKYKNPPMGQHGAVAPPPFEENLDPGALCL